MGEVCGNEEFCGNEETTSLCLGAHLRCTVGGCRDDCDI
jgi:hypothetical protein